METQSAINDEGTDPKQYYENMQKLIAASGQYKFKVSLSIPEYVKKYGVEGTPRFAGHQIEALSGRVVKIYDTTCNARLFCYDIYGEGAKVQVRATTIDSHLSESAFTKLHSGVKLGDVVGVRGLPGYRKSGGVTIYPTEFGVLFRCLHTLPPQKGAQLDTTKVALRVRENAASIVTTTNHRAGKFDAKLYEKVVLEGSQNASIVTTTDHGAGKFEAKLYGKILQEETGCVKGSFGTTKALASNLDGKRGFGLSHLFFGWWKFIAVYTISLTPSSSTCLYAFTSGGEIASF